MEYKYLILDFGKVLAAPTTGEWLVTPEFLKNVDINKVDKDKLKEAFKKNKYMLDGKVETVDEEYELLYKFYQMVLNDACYEIADEGIGNIAKDFIYGDSKYTLYNDVVEELDRLSRKYTLLVLSDNWPCLYNYMKKKDIYKFFKKVYVSSVYGELKKEGKFFNHPIEEFNIKSGEALFIDDSEMLLDVAVQKGLDVKLMDRAKIVNNSKYDIINKLADIK